jgi:hydrogenase nickel incorporation protein HypB
MKTITHLRDKYHISVIEGDVASSIDADRIKGMSIQAVQINTGGGCHLDCGNDNKGAKQSELDQLT